MPVDETTEDIHDDRPVDEPPGDEHPDRPTDEPTGDDRPDPPGDEYPPFVWPETDWPDPSDEESFAPSPEDPVRFDLYQACLHFGESLDGSMEGELEARYRLLAAHYDRNGRYELLIQITAAVSAGNGSVTSLFPFILYESDPGLIGMAAYESALVMDPPGDAPLAGPGAILSLAAEPYDEVTRAAILAGVLLLGDRRVNALHPGSWRVVSPAARTIILEAWSGYLYASTIDYLIDWGMDAERPELLAILDRLALLPAMAEGSCVIDLERVFPVQSAEEGKQVKLLGGATTDEYGQIERDALLGLAARAGDPARSFALCEAWGL